MNERIQKRIEELTKARDTYVEQANREIAALNGAIGELTALLAPEEKADEGLTGPGFTVEPDGALEVEQAGAAN